MLAALYKLFREQRAGKGRERKERVVPSTGGYRRLIQGLCLLFGHPLTNGNKTTATGASLTYLDSSISFTLMRDSRDTRFAYATAFTVAPETPIRRSRVHVLRTILHAASAGSKRHEGGTRSHVHLTVHGHVVTYTNAIGTLTDDCTALCILSGIR